MHYKRAPFAMQISAAIHQSAFSLRRNLRDTSVRASVRSTAAPWLVSVCVDLRSACEINFTACPRMRAAERQRSGSETGRRIAVSMRERETRGNLDHPSYGLIIMAFCFSAFCFGRESHSLGPRRRECGYLRARVCERPVLTSVRLARVYACSLHTPRAYSYAGPGCARERKPWMLRKEERLEAGETDGSTRGRRSQSVGLWPRNNRPAPLN